MLYVTPDRSGKLELNLISLKKEPITQKMEKHCRQKSYNINTPLKS